LSRCGGKKEELLLPLPVEAALRLPFKIDPTADQIATQFLFGDQKFGRECICLILHHIGRDAVRNDVA
jgi:hypothetical protein